MFTDFCGLDCAWRGLWVNVFVASLILAVMVAGVKLLARQLSQRQMKWYLTIQYVGLALVLVGNFVWIAFADPELASRCFAQFAKVTESFTLTRFTAGTWLTIVVGLLLIDVARILLTIKINLRQDRASARKWGLLARQIARRMGLKNAPLMVFEKNSIVPHVVGLFRHKIVLPKDLDQKPEEMVKNILAHEMAHVRDRDTLWMLAELFCRRLLFFHPLVYILRRDYQMTIEKAADELAVRTNDIHPSSFVKTLCRVSEDFAQAGRPTPIQVNATRGFREMKQRVEALVQLRGHRSASGRAFALLATLTLLIIGGLSVAHAGAVARHKGSFTEVNMCSQLNQEKMIESWLRIEREANQCEK